MTSDIERGKYKQLDPKKRGDGVIVVGNRESHWMHMSYDKNELILLAHEHRLSKLYAEYIH